MSKWTKEELEDMLEDVVNELNLSDSVIAEHGPMGTAPAQLVRLVLQQKDQTIRMLKAGMIDASSYPTPSGDVERLVDELITAFIKLRWCPDEDVIEYRKCFDDAKDRLLSLAAPGAELVEAAKQYLSTHALVDQMALQMVIDKIEGKEGR